MIARPVVALSGGIGGAKLALGLYRALPSRTLSVIVNTGDDFDHLGLRICPDLDTALYTLAGLANTEQGWGRRDDTWTFMHALQSLGGETWFNLGDGDLALHIERTRRLGNGESLSAIAADIARRLGIEAAVIPATDESVRTRVITDAGELSFQDYFVRRKCAPGVQSLQFAGSETASLSDAASHALDADSLDAIVICPSNPYLSIDPILAIPGVRDLLEESHAPVIAVSPIVGGQALKGPASKIMKELGVEPSALSVAQHYGELIDGFVLDEQDRASAGLFDVPVHVTNTVMHTLADRERLARETLSFAENLKRARKRRA